MSLLLFTGVQERERPHDTAARADLQHCLDKNALYRD